MSEDPDDDTRFDPAEARLHELLEPLRDDPPRSQPGMALDVVRTARWQSSVRGALRAVSHFAVAAADVARLLLGRRRARSGR